jgi:hypothetical protein
MITYIREKGEGNKEQWKYLYCTLTFAFLSHRGRGPLLKRRGIGTRG